MFIRLIIMQQNLIKCLYYYQFLFIVNQSSTIFIKKNIYFIIYVNVTKRLNKNYH